MSCDGGLGIIIQRDAGERAGRIFRFLLEEGDFAVRVGGNGIVFFDLFQISNIVNGERGRVFGEAEFSEIAEFIAEQIVPGDHDQIVVHVLAS